MNGQWLVVTGFYERYIANSIQQFIDLCSVANISVFVMTHENYGFYLHGRYKSLSLQVPCQQSGLYLFICPMQTQISARLGGHRYAEPRRTIETRTGGFMRAPRIGARVRAADLRDGSAAQNARLLPQSHGAARHISKFQSSFISHTGLHRITNHSLKLTPTLIY